MTSQQGPEGHTGGGVRKQTASVGKQTAGARPWPEPGSVGSTPVAAEISSRPPCLRVPLAPQGSVREPLGRYFATHSSKSGNLEATGRKCAHPRANRTAAGEQSVLVPYIKLGTEQALHEDWLSENIYALVSPYNGPLRATAFSASLHLPVSTPLQSVSGRCSISSVPLPPPSPLP